MRITKRLQIGVWLCLMIALVPQTARAGKRIGIFSFSDQTRYMDAIRGFEDTLKEAGFGEPQTVFFRENAHGNKAVAAETVQRLAAAKMDLIFAAGTHSALAILQEIKDVPVVFAQVYDPVEAGIAKDWQSSGNNSTGTSTKIPMSKLLDSLKLLTPAKSLAVLYTPGEKNSETQFMDLQELQTKYEIKVIPAPLSKADEVDQLLPVILHTVDALFITGSNFVDSHIATIVDQTIKARKVTLSHLEDLIDKGVLLGVCANAYSIGRLAGEKAIKILQGVKPSAIPIESLGKTDVMLNLKTARAGDFQIPPEFMKTVTRKIE